MHLRSRSKNSLAKRQRSVAALAEIRREESDLVASTLFALCFLLGTSPLAGQEAGWPTRHWVRATPESEGFDSGRLIALFDSVKQRNMPIHSLLIVRNGRLLLDATFSPYTAGTVHDLASVTKSITSTLIGIAIDKGYVKGVDEPVLGFFPERRFANIDSRKRALTLRHLLTMTSGLCGDFRSGEEQNEIVRRSDDWVQTILDAPLVSEPGAHFAYCSASSNLLSKGSWEGKQLVSAAWVQEATRPHVQTGADEAYGFKWWIIPSLGLYEGRGRGGQRISILPSKNLVVVVNGTGNFDPGDIGTLLLAAVTSTAPLPENPVACAELQRRIIDAAKSASRQQPAHLPDLARQISGRTIRCRLNTIGLQTLQFGFAASDSATMRYTYRDSLNHENGDYDLVVGLDGAYRVSDGSRFHLPVASRGSWKSDTEFCLETQMAGNNHLYRWNFDFMPPDVEISLSDEGLGNAMFHATIE